MKPWRQFTPPRCPGTECARFFPPEVRGHSGGRASRLAALSAKGHTQ